MTCRTHRWHHSLALEPSPNAVVDTFRLAPVGGNAFVGVALVTIEALRVCTVAR